jgi:DNA-binding NtrC family response regulator
MKSLHPDVPVVIMSAYWTEEAKDECARLGTTQFLDKPLKSAHLLATVTRAVLAGLASREPGGMQARKGPVPTEQPE